MRRVPPKHPFAEAFTQGRWSPALVLFWHHGRPGQPEDWFAQVVIDDINEPGHALELLVSARDIRPAFMTDALTSARTAPLR
jgi:hypothetical protein